MEIGNVIIADGKVGVVTRFHLKDDGDCLVCGFYLNNITFVLDEIKCTILDYNLNDYINRHVAKFGKLKVSSRGKK